MGGRYIRSGLLAALVGQALMPGMSWAHPDTGTHVDALSANVGSTVVTVSGTASFVDIPMIVGEDGAGDVSVAGIGADVTNAVISRPNPASSQVRFTFEIADQPADLHGFPALVYNWPLAVDGEDAAYFLNAGRINGNTLNTSKSFFLLQDQGDGFTIRATLTGTMEGGKVTWNINPSAFGGSAGSVLSLGGGGLGVFGTTTGVGGRGFLSGNTLGDAAQWDLEYTIPAVKVSLGIAKAGTPPELVPLTHTASVNASSGSFTGAVPRPTQIGQYVLVAQACYGVDNCGLHSASITV